MLPERSPAPAPGPSITVLLILSCCALACGAEGYQRRADRSVAAVLAQGTSASVARRQEEVRYPELRATGDETRDEEASDAESAAPASPTVRHLDLAGALAIAVRGNRDYITQKEALYLAALSLIGTRHTFSPRLSTTLAYTFADGAGIPTTNDGAVDARLTQILPFGGDLTVSAGTSVFDTNSGTATDPTTFGSDLSISLRQPLLRGAGAEVTLEPLVQAERELIYAIRDFELFREDFSIDVARRFYDLVQQKQSIENQDQNLESFRHSRAQAEALYGVGRTSSLDVLRARRSELTSENSLLGARESYLLALDRFRIFLGLPDSVELEIDAVAPAFTPIAYDMASALEVALLNRLDLMNRVEQLEDAERGVRIARNGLLPDLDLDLSTGLTSSGAASFGDQSFGSDYRLGVTLSLPLDRVNEGNAYRSAQIFLERARRSYEEFRDELVVGIQSAFRELARRKSSLEIQRELIRDQQRNVRIAQIRFQRGDISNRDKVEAEDALLDARNQLIREQVNYEISRLQLLRDLGILFIDDQGQWDAAAAPPAEAARDARTPTDNQVKDE